MQDQAQAEDRVKRYMRIIVGRTVPVRFYDESRIDEFMRCVRESYRVFGTPLDLVDFAELRRGILSGGEYVVLDLPGEYHVFLRRGHTLYDLIHALGHIAQVERLRLVAGVRVDGFINQLLFAAAGVINNMMNNVLVDYYVYGRLRRVEPHRAEAYLEYMREEESESAERVASIALATGLTDVYHMVSHLAGVHSGRELTRREKAAVERLAREGTPEAAVEVMDALARALSLAAHRARGSSQVEPHPARRRVRRYTLRIQWL